VSRRVLLLLAAGVAAALTGCATLPTPSQDQDSLVVLVQESPAPRVGPETGPGVLRFTGPTALSVPVAADPQKLVFLKVRPGTYTPDTAGFVAGGQDVAPLVVPPGSVVLFPWKITRVTQAGARVRRLAPLSSDDQQAASEGLTDYIDFGKWFGRTAIGFGAHIPRLVPEQGNVPYTITSTPPGASVSIDDQPFGATPLTVTLRTGKHLLALEIPGVAVTRTYVTVASAGSIDITMPVMVEQEVQAATEKAGRRTLLISSFQNMGSADADNLAAVFPQVIRSDLRDDTLLDLVDASSVVSPGVPGKPDFAEADRKGIDLIVSGYYDSRPDGLLVYAALYDVRTEMARSSIVYTGKAGLSMFDSIDSMATEFIARIDTVLPEVGRPLVDESAGVQSRIVSVEKKRSETDLIARRAEHRSSLTLFSGPQTVGIVDREYPALPNTVAALLPVGLAWDYVLAGPLSLTVALQPAITWDSASEASPGPYLTQPFVDVPLRIGPTYTLSGWNVDLSFSLQGEIRYLQAFYELGEGPVYLPSLVGSISLFTSARAYVNRKLSELPQFIEFGFSWFIAGVQTDLQLANPVPVPLALQLTLGYGVRL
jgi:hypothetical protein